MRLKSGLVVHIFEGKYSGIYLCTPNSYYCDRHIIVTQQIIAKRIWQTEVSEES